MIASFGRASSMKLDPWRKNYARRGSMSSHPRRKANFKKTNSLIKSCTRPLKKLFKLVLTFHDLEEVELRQAAYWRPRSIGEVIFNCWD